MPAQTICPRVEQVDAVGEVDDPARVLLDQQDRAPRFLEIGDDFVNLVDDDGREAERGLVDHQDAPAGQQPAADGEHAALAAREGARELRRALLQPGQDLVNLLDLLLEGLAHPGQIGAHLEVVVDAHVREQHVALRDQDDPEPDHGLGLGAFDPPPCQLDLAAARLEQSGDAAQQRGLAVPVGAEEGDQPAFGHLERDVLEDALALIPCMQVADGEEQLSHRPPPVPPACAAGDPPCPRQDRPRRRGGRSAAPGCRPHRSSRRDA